MAKEKKPVHKVQMTDGKRQIIQQLLQEYDIETAEDIQDALKDLLGGTIKEMMEAEMDDHLGYQKSERYGSDVYRNGCRLHNLSPRAAQNKTYTSPLQIRFTDVSKRLSYTAFRYAFCILPVFLLPYNPPVF